MDVTVVVATYGDRKWQDLAREPAVPSACAEDVPVIGIHDDTLHDARNTGLRMVMTPYVAFLDADDEIEPGYFSHIERSNADLRAPSVRYVENDPWVNPRMPRVAAHTHLCGADCLTEGNWLVIGTVAPTDLLRKVGGFRDFPMYEDWDLWVRCWRAGATIEAVPAAVYRAHVRRDSRNRQPKHSARLNAHRAIARANNLPVPA